MLIKLLSDDDREGLPETHRGPISVHDAASACAPTFINKAWCHWEANRRIEESRGIGERKPAFSASPIPRFIVLYIPIKIFKGPARRSPSLFHCRAEKKFAKKDEPVVLVNG
jgi:hypothetical protein